MSKENSANNKNEIVPRMLSKVSRQLQLKYSVLACNILGNLRLYDRNLIILLVSNSELQIDHY